MGSFLAIGGAAISLPTPMLVAIVASVVVVTIGAGLALWRVRRRSTRQDLSVRVPLDGLHGPMAAHAAFRCIEAEIVRIDPAFRLTLLTSSDSIDHFGLSYTWEFLADLPTRQARAIGALRPLSDGSGDDDEGESPALCIELDVRPGRLLAPNGETLPALPRKFVDSPAAVAELASQGADFIGGDTSMTLSTKVLPSGRAVWHTHCFDREYRSDFATSVEDSALA
jgi:hypothetical protein